jgi:CTD small phosphatase-like protein 2
VFTASHHAYADVVLDILDPNKELISLRLYREHCTETPDGVFIKDLRIFKGVEIKDILIVDNAAYSFGY